MTPDETRRAQIAERLRAADYRLDPNELWNDVEWLLAELSRLSEAQQQLEAIDKVVPRRRESPDVPLVERVVQAVVQMQYDDERCRTWESEAATARVEVARLSEAQQPWNATDDLPLFLVWDRQRQCWAGDDVHGATNTRDLQDYALDEFKDAGFVYCDMEGWSLNDEGGLYLHDECSTSIEVDAARFEVRMNPIWLAKVGHESALRWRERAEKAEAEVARLSEAREALRAEAWTLVQMVLNSRQNVGGQMLTQARALARLTAAPEAQPEGEKR